MTQLFFISGTNCISGEGGCSGLHSITGNIEGFLGGKSEVGDLKRAVAGGDERLASRLRAIGIARESMECMAAGCFWRTEDQRKEKSGCLRRAEIMSTPPKT